MEPPGDAVENSEIVDLNATGKPSFNPRRDITVAAPTKSQPPEDKPGVTAARLSRSC
jgi:hypothetical protein